MELNKSANIALWFVIGFGIFIALIALIFAVNVEFDAAFATAVVAAGFIGLGWAGRRLLLPKDEDAPLGVGIVAGVIFGGAGLVMMLGSVFLFWDGEIEGFIGLFIFGFIFSLAGYIGYRVFSIPKGKKAVLITKRQQTISGVSRYKGQRTSRQYVYVDKDLPESEVIKMQNEWAEMPWHQRSDWAEGRIIESGPGSILLLVIFTILWNLVSCGVASFALISEWGSGNEPWFVLIFPVVGLLLIIMTIRTAIRRRKYGISIFEIGTIPAYIGDYLKGVVKTGVKAENQPTEGFSLQLACIERSSYRDRDGDHRVSERELWSDEQQVYGFISTTKPTLDIDVSFAIPNDLPVSQLIPEDDRTLWRLKVTGSTPGVDYVANFEVPVFEKES